MERRLGILAPSTSVVLETVEDDSENVLYNAFEGKLIADTPSSDCGPQRRIQLLGRLLEFILAAQVRNQLAAVGLNEAEGAVRAEIEIWMTAAQWERKRGAGRRGTRAA